MYSEAERHLTPKSKSSACLGNLGDRSPDLTPMSSSDEESSCLEHVEEPPGVGGKGSKGQLYFMDQETSNKDFLTEDDIYCCCLSKTLLHTSTPVTIGFYCPVGSRFNSLLDKITACMLKESIQREEEELRKSHQKPRRPEGWGYFLLLWYLLFYQPVITEVHLRRENIQFLFIRFSAWQYAGSDKLWAGLVTTLCQSIRKHFGALPLSFYHVMGKRPRFASGFSQDEWLLNKRTCLSLGGLVFVLVAGVSLLSVAIFVPGIKDSSALKVIGSATTGLSGSGILVTVFSVVKNMVISQKQKIEKMTDSEKFSSHLGFMSEVKKEIEMLTSFVYYMEIYQRRRLRIVLEITSLDMCYPERVVGVLNAINTLLSDTNAPFIFILVIDPSIIAPCLEQTSCMKGMADNGYLFLNRTVTLPFSIPEMGTKSKLQHLQDAVQSREDLMYKIITKNMERGVRNVKGKMIKLVDMETSSEMDQSQIDAQAVRYIHEAFHALHNHTDCLYKYIPDSIIQMKRIVNTIPITIRLMLQQNIMRHTMSPRSVAAWVVLANQWPCRLSWVLQCLEDRQQIRPTEEFRNQSLWGIFVENCKELYSMHKVLQNILALDGDPELFQNFLSNDFPFTVQEANTFLKSTINLDHSIRHKLGLIRGVNSLNKANDTSVTKSSVKTVQVSTGVQCSGIEECS
ncbi:NTPase KAP family P-loop domain-containing protein 1 [Gopherus flavomarginatus]|uniref:NTPase KAP family P-loop domain-containing protein 1 n=1 Tax=Gopherus flavomarginatus TaxID=286002 RepID=UPI0021CC09EC|nr:NTPase KAP family P-loop domain-containing protein 1 [Gopherus flavomarginatus]